MFTQEDLLQIQKHGLTQNTVDVQLANFKLGFPTLKVVRVASPGDGVLIATQEIINRSVTHYEDNIDKIKVVKFVPASGAATRMFKELFEFVNDNKRGEGIDFLLDNIQQFAFWPELKAILPDGADDKGIVSMIIKEGLCYGDKPKGLVTFHNDPEGGRKAVEEHLAEGATYATSNGVTSIHFTVSSEHMDGFKALLCEKTPLYEKKYGVSYNITFSSQKPSTDTIAVNPDNTPFRQEDDTLLFRPAGHGALIENLNDIDADIIFVKNIDNVTTEAQRKDTVLYKKTLAGILIEIQHKEFELLESLEIDNIDLNPVVDFIENKLCVKLPKIYTTELLKEILNRPIRVCGMVRNEGEPGGGPFWVANPDGTESLQIAESSQISSDDIPLMSSATHFNPVDLVCGVRTSKGEKFDLRKYVDTETGFISSKSSGGRQLRAQELPGLWNGAMANWNTIFVDVPISTFSPVKVVQDLLRPQHQ